MSVIERVVAGWRASGVKLNAGASGERIERLQLRVGTALPDDLRRFYALADGMQDDGEADRFLINFWSIDKLLVEVQAMTDAGHPMDARDTPIADCLLGSWFLWLRRLGDGRVGVWVEVSDREFPSLTAFLEAYESAREDPSIFGWKSVD